MALARTAALAAGLLIPGDGAGTGEERHSEGPADAATRIGFAGDVMLGRGVDRAHAAAPPSAVWGSMYEHLRGLDGFLANLECVFSERGEPWPDKRFHFRARPDWALAALEAVDATAVSLANNHAMDFGPDALLDTIEHLESIGVGHTGAGPTLDAALEPAIVDVDGLTLATFGLVDHWGAFAADRASAGSNDAETGPVGEDAVGTAYVDVDENPQQARSLSEIALARAADAEPDLLVASLHFGYNYATQPTAEHRRFAHWLVDSGVDLVHGHSAHVVQGVEVYDGAPIVYDAGEFVDDYADHPEYHNDRSYLFELVPAGDGADRRLRLVPVEIADYRVRRARDAVATALERTIRERSASFDTTFESAPESGVLRVPLQ